MIKMRLEHTHGECVYHGSPKPTIETHDALLLEDLNQDTEHGLLVLTLTRRQRLDARFGTDTRRQLSSKDSRETQTRLEDILHCKRVNFVPGHEREMHPRRAKAASKCTS